MSDIYEDPQRAADLCTSDDPGTSAPPTKEAGNEGSGPSAGGVIRGAAALIKRVLVSRTRVYLGESFAISVKTWDGNGQSPVQVAINGTLGHRQLFQFTDHPGPRKLLVTAYDESKQFQAMEVSIEVLEPTPCTRFPLLEIGQDITGASTIICTLGNSTDFHDANAVYLWDFGDGGQDVSEGPTVRHSYEESLSRDEPYSTFHLRLTMRHPDQTEVTVGRSVTVWNVYAVNKRRGLIQPKLFYDFRARREAQMLMSKCTIRNLEDESLHFDTRQTEILWNDPERVTMPGKPEQFELVVEPRASVEIDASIPYSDLPAGAFGYAVHLHGRTPSGYRVSASAYFEHNLNPQLATVVRLPGAVEFLNRLRNGSCNRNQDIITGADIDQVLTTRAGSMGLPDLRAEIGLALSGQQLMHHQAGHSEDLVGKECIADEEPPNPDLACQLTEEWAWVAVPARFINAKKGDVVLTPGGTGPISGLLRQVSPPQMYPHMGIMIQNFYRLRHSTASDEWLADAAVGSLLGHKGTEGLDPDKLRYIWPGTLDQSVEEAVNGSMLADPDNTTDDAGNVKHYRIAAFSAHAKMNTNREIIDPLVVKPDPLIEARKPQLRQTLHRVAEAAKQIKGHYRFFCYTKAQASLDDSTEFNAPDRGPGWWGSRTRATVCSSLIWAAVRSVKEMAIRLEGEEILAKPSDLEATDVGAEVDSHTSDGLYFYTQAERQAAANWLYRYFYELAYAKAGDLGRLLTDAPSDLANQICNTFAFDWTGEDGSGTHSKDSDRWKDPGDGRAVSPDDIVKFWDAPSDAENVTHGLYGFSEKLIYRPAHLEWRKVSRWAKVDREAELTGTVQYRGKLVPGATVKVAGKDTSTDAQGRFRLKVPAGKYRAEAGKLINGWFVEGAVDVDLAPTSTTHRLITLSEPPDWFRVITIRGTMHIHDDETGKDQWADRAFFQTGIRVGPFGTHAETSWFEKMGGEIRVEVYLKLDWQLNSSVNVWYHVKLFEGTSEDTGDLDGETTGGVNVLRDATRPIDVSVHNTQEEAGDHVNLNLTLTNARQP